MLLCVNFTKFYKYFENFSKIKPTIEKKSKKY